MTSLPVVSRLLRPYAGTALTAVADSQPQVLNPLAVSRLAQLNEAERQLRALGIRVVKRQLNEQLNGRNSTVLVEAPNAALLDAHSDGGRRLTRCLVGHDQGFMLRVFGVDVIWREHA
ncbi:hypothetical protein QWZ03_18095 [Chitinimonas viridis]|uniref:Uncharacterized protein n=1 Tax=Chitinimonas viridis TaxID=664880 RepID=A0ABT8BAR5_9NEIS|nr:hypothetical protein [Chitinimonas viridis]MDN3578681.1 hypothetical protein [Chitinimonas viridis]